MTKASKLDISELTSAAQSLETELRRFEEAVEEARTIPLNSRKNLERSAKTLSEVASIDERLGQHVQTLAVSISAARERRQAQAELVNVRAKEIQARTEILQGLLLKYGELGQHAADLNGLMQQVAVHRQEAKTPEQHEEVHATLQQLQERMGQVAQSAAALSQEASEQDFGDLARQTDGMRQQLLAARNKMNLLLQRPEQKEWKN